MEFSYQYSLVDKAYLEKEALKLSDYVTHLNSVFMKGGYDYPESSLNLPTDQSMIKEVQAVGKQFGSEKLKYVLVVGIGGSSLGTKAVYDAWCGYFDLLERQRYPKLIFIETVDPWLMTRLEKMLAEEIADPAELVINIISKSGGTTETVANAEVLLEMLKRKQPGIMERVVVTTDQGSKLWQAAETMGLSRLAVPAEVGGRYSVFSAVGLLPLHLAGVDIFELLAGAAEVRAKCLDDKWVHNPALISALVVAYNWQHKKRTIVDSFIFCPALESAGRWYRQLLAESIGKEKDVRGKKVKIGLTPTVSIGSTDLHSVGQLYLGGPADKIFTIISVQKMPEVKMPADRIWPAVVADVSGHNYETVLAAILRGTMKAYEQQGLPFMEIVLDELNERSVGQLLQFKMLEVMFLAKLLNVNAFDQPNVEAYKKETREILSMKSL